MVRYAVMGCGSMGTVLGAYITRAGIPVDMVDANAEHVEALNRHGAQIGGTVSMTVPVRAMAPEQMEGVYDIVFYFVKQTYNDAAIRQLRPHTDESTILCTLQNGFPELALEKHFSRDSIMGCTVGWGATWTAPGRSDLTSDPDSMTLHLGRLNGDIDDRVKEVQRILEYICPTSVTGNLSGARWTKLLMNAAWSGMSASLGCDFGTILDTPDAFDCISFIANECIRVGDAAGFKMEPYSRYDMHADFAFDTESERRAAFPVFREIWTPHRALTASMLQDLQKGRATEINAINGVVCETGRKYGIPTPFNDKVVEVVTAAQEGKGPFSMENLRRFEGVLAEAKAALRP
jgi:2-dehydropantoate 2-reductase